MEGNFKWPPLESDPSIFSEYAHNLGLSQNYSFEEIFSLDYKEVMGEITNPVYSVIISFEELIKHEINKESLNSSETVPFFMLQTEVLDNACGLLAILHAIGNKLNELEIEEDSILKSFYEATKILNAEDKSKLLEKSQKIKTIHDLYASQGQSNLCEVQDDVKNHFIAFICHNSNLIELDGLKSGPYIIKQGIKNSDLLDETIGEIKKRLNNEEISDKISIMFLTRND